jgi:hypothetical protein
MTLPSLHAQFEHSIRRLSHLRIDENEAMSVMAHYMWRPGVPGGPIDQAAYVKLAKRLLQYEGALRQLYRDHFKAYAENSRRNQLCVFWLKSL